jgi:hypothetical protein
MVLLNDFPKSRRHFKFKYVVTNNIRIDIHTIISLVIMIFDKFQKKLNFNVLEYEALNEFVSYN